MSVTRVASRYAKSLLELAIDQKNLERVKEDVDGIITALKSRDFYLMLKSPIIHTSKKQSILDVLFKGKFDALTLAFLHVLVRKGREMYLPEMAYEFQTQYKALKGITTVRIITASPVSTAFLEEVKAKLAESKVTRKHIELIPEVNPDLIGGFILEFDDKMYDASVHHQLETMRKQLINKQVA